MPVDLLVSFCNVGSATEFALAAVELATGSVAIVDLTPIGQSISYGGITGLCRCGAGYAMALQSTPAAIALLNTDLAVMDIVRLKLVRDAHSILEMGGELLIASTGTDSIIAFDPRTRHERVFHAVTDAGRDTLHLNAICLHGARLMACMFGERHDNRVRTGRVIDVASGAVVLDGLRQPQSLASAGDHMLVLESETAHLVKFDGTYTIDPWVTFSGYARGIWLPDGPAPGGRIVVGRSSRRRASRGGNWSKHGLMSLPMEGGGLEHDQAALIIREADCSTRSIMLTSLAGEIYDVLGLHTACAPKTLALAWVAAHAAVRRDDAAGVEAALMRRTGEVVANSLLPGLTLAEMRISRGDTVGALAAIEGLNGNGAAGANLLRVRSAIMARAGKPNAAIEYAQAACAMLPEDGDLHMQLFHLLRQRGDLTQAEAAVRAAIACNTQTSGRWLALSLLLLQMERGPEALEAVQQAQLLAPMRAEILALHGRVLRLAGAFRESAEMLRKSVAIEPENWNSWWQLGTVLQSLGELPAAADAFDVANRIDPDNDRLRERAASLRKTIRGRAAARARNF